MLKLLNLIKYNDIIKPGQRFVKVGNTYMPVGIGGSIAQVSGESEGSSDGYVVIEEDGVLKAQKLAFDGTTASPDGSAEAIGSVGLFNMGMEEPAYKGSGGGGSFYKCASVDGTTWSGYEAIQAEDGTWDFESTVTSDLEFGLGYTPEIGKVYNEDATIEVGKYWDGLFGYSYIKFASNNLVTEGDTLQVTDGSNYNFETIDGYKCINMNGLVASYVLTGYTTEGATFSIWGKKNDNYVNNVANAHFLSHFGSDSGSIMMDNIGRWKSKLNEQWYDITSSWDWQHWVCRFTNNTLEIFHNGNNQNISQTFSFRAIDTIGIGDWYGNPGERTCYGYAADLRMFNRALSDTEIKALYNNGIQE